MIFFLKKHYKNFTKQQLRAIDNNLNQIAKKVNSLNFINEDYHEQKTDKLNQFII